MEKIEKENQKAVSCLHENVSVAKLIGKGHPFIDTIKHVRVSN